MKLCTLRAGGKLCLCPAVVQRVFGRQAAEQALPSKTHLPACCLISPKSACSNLIIVLSGDDSLNGDEVVQSAHRKREGSGLQGILHLLLRARAGWGAGDDRYSLGFHPKTHQGSHQHVMLPQSFLHHRRDPLSLVLKNNSGLIPVPTAIQARVFALQKCSAVA